MEDKLLLALKKVCSSEDKGALVTILNTKGSTPRKAGAKMLVLEDGQVFGTIGGGCGEAEVKREALNVLRGLKPTKYLVNMTQDLAEEEGMVCGGIMEVLIDILPSGQSKEKQFLKEYIEAFEKNEEPLLITVIQGIKDGETIVLGKNFINSTGSEISTLSEDKLRQKIRDMVDLNKEGKIKLIKDGDLELLVEPATSPVELVILGGGHIALPLHDMAKTLGYHITVVDDRPLFANKERFNRADRVICDSFTQAIENIDISARTFVVIVTRGHRHDKLCLLAVIDKPASYIGMIGSKRRVKALKEEIIEGGISSELVAKIHSPIGLDIGAETPEEIAVSILAEIISVHRNRKTVNLCEK